MGEGAARFRAFSNSTMLHCAVDQMLSITHLLKFGGVHFALPPETMHPYPHDVSTPPGWFGYRAMVARSPFSCSPI